MATGSEEVSLKYSSPSVDKTVWLGKRLGALLGRGDVVALIGDLGGGKTWFTKGVAEGLEIDPKEIVSPTFTLVNEYKGKYPFFHMDLYRLEHGEEISALGLEDYFSGNGIVVMEWADRWPDRVPEERILIEFRILDYGNREIKFSGTRDRARYIIEALRKIK